MNLKYQTKSSHFTAALICMCNFTAAEVKVGLILTALYNAELASYSIRSLYFHAAALGEKYI